MKYLYQNKYWEVAKEYNIDKLLYLMIDRPSKVDYDFIWRNKKNHRHRDYDLPSFVGFYNNEKCDLCWDKDGMFHRKNNKPAVIDFDGHKKYFINNKFIKSELLK